MKMLLVRIAGAAVLGFLLVSSGLAAGESQFTSIDGVYVERTVTEDGEAKTVPHRLSQTRIEKGDVIAFDIPGVNDYIRDNHKLLQHIVLLVDDIELPEFKAYLESAESGVIRFRFDTRKLEFEHRKALYKLPGKSEKQVLLGIKLDESNVLHYHEPATVYFKEIRRWGGLGWILIVCLLLFFGLLIFKYQRMIKDDPPAVGDGSYAPRFSFSKSQFAFWTFLVLASYIYIWSSTGEMQSINTTGLILLGITSITITTSQLIGKNQEVQAVRATRNKEAVKTRAKKEDQSSNFLEDILSDANGISIHRLQAVVFNLVFGIAFVKSVILDYSMPEFSEIQFILLGLSNGTYAFLKNSENK